MCNRNNFCFTSGRCVFGNAILNKESRLRSCPQPFTASYYQSRDMLDNNMAALEICPTAIELVHINVDDVVAVGTILQVQEQDSPILLHS